MDAFSSLFLGSPDFQRLEIPSHIFSGAAEDLKMTKRRTPRNAARTKAEPAPDVKGVQRKDPFHMVSDTRIDIAIRLRLAINMLREKDGRGLPLIHELAEKGKPKHRARAVAALLRYRAGAVAKDTGEMNFTKAELDEWLKELECEGVERRNHARAWAALIATPKVIIDYLASTEDEDGRA